MRTLMSMIVAGLLLTVTPGPLPAEEPSTVRETMSEGKENFEKTCSFCHTLSRSLSKVKDRKQWTRVVKKMVTYGAPLNSHKRETVITYLTARSNFQKSCNACHSSVRVLAEPVAGKDWTVIVKRMGEHLTELAQKDEESRKLDDREIEEIGAFLSVVIPEK